MKKLIFIIILTLLIVTSATAFNFIDWVTGYATKKDCDPEHKIKICHVPPGNPNNTRMLCVDNNSLDGHGEHELDIIPITDLSEDGIIDNQDCIIAVTPEIPETNKTCVENETRPCNQEYFLGICQPGIQTCINGNWSDCLNQTQPQPETCNSLDDDCDGSIDESLIELCGSTDIGECEYGFKTCTEGQWSECINETQPTEEICDLLDNDCNSLIDDNITCECLNNETRACGSDIGQCTEGTQNCINNIWSECINETQPIEETCNSLDDDCDELIDEELTCTQTAAPSGGGGGGGSSRKKVTKKLTKIQTTQSSKGKSGLEIQIINPPERVDIADKKLIIQAELKNTGTTNINNIQTELKTSQGWKTDKKQKLDLEAGESQTVEFILESDYCNIKNPDGNKNFNKQTIELNAKANSLQHETQSSANIPLNIPKLTVSSAIADYSETNRLKACFFINNLNQQQRNIELEFEVDDNTRDVIFDYITPITLEKDQILIKEKTYTLKKIPRQKPYELKATIYDNGKLFQKGYKSAHASEDIDLTNFKNKSRLKNLINKIKNLFKKR